MQRWATEAATKERNLVSSVAAMILQTIQVLVALTTHLAPIGLVLLHARAVKVRRVGLRVDDGKRAVVILLEFLILVPVQPVVLQPVLVLVCLLASNHRTLERLVLLVLHHIQVAGRVVNVHAITIVHVAVGVSSSGTAGLLGVGHLGSYALWLGLHRMHGVMFGVVYGQLGQNGVDQSTLVNCLQLDVKVGGRKV